MPHAPPRVCSCGSIVPAGKSCPRCAKASDAARGTARQRGYDRDWQRLREEHLARHPACAECGATGAVDVDHVVPLREAPHRRLDPTNLRTLCRRHHNRVTHGRANTPQGG